MPANLSTALRNPRLRESACRRLLEGARRIPSTGCWEWRRGLRNGYASLKVGRDAQLGSRVSYTLFRDEIPSGAFVCHHCDNPKCINPYHLFVGDQSANMADMKQKGRQRSLVGEQSNMAKITATDVAALRERYRAGESPKAIGSDYGLTYNAVWQIATGKVWKHLPGKCESRGWRYRKSKMTPEQIAEAAGLNAAGESFEKLAKRYGVVSGTVHRLVSSLRKGA